MTHSSCCAPNLAVILDSFLHSTSNPLASLLTLPSKNPHFHCCFSSLSCCLLSPPLQQHPPNLCPCPHSCSPKNRACLPCHSLVQKSVITLRIKSNILQWPTNPSWYGPCLPLLPPLGALYLPWPSSGWPHPRLSHLVQVSTSLPHPPRGLPWPPCERAPSLIPLHSLFLLNFPSYQLLSAKYICLLSIIPPLECKTLKAELLSVLLSNALVHRKYSMKYSIFQAEWLTDFWEQQWPVALPSSQTMTKRILK